MEKTVTIEEISYTLKTRNVRESKELRNKLKIDGFKSGNEAGLGDFQVLSVFSSLKSWSRKEPLTQENFENLTPEPHIDRLFEVSQEVNTLSEAEKN